MSDEEKRQNELEKITPAVLATVRFKDRLTYTHYTEKQLKKEEDNKFYFSLPDIKELEIPEEMMKNVVNMLKEYFEQESHLVFIESDDTEKYLKKYEKSQKVRKFFWPFLSENLFTEDRYNYSDTAFRERYVTTDKSNSSTYRTTVYNYRIIEPDKKLVRRLLLQTKANSIIFFIVDFDILKVRDKGFKAQVYGEVNMCIETFWNRYFPQVWQCLSLPISYRRFQENPEIALGEIENQIINSIEALVGTYLDSIAKVSEFKYSDLDR